MTAEKRLDALDLIHHIVVGARSNTTDTERGAQECAAVRRVTTGGLE